jgi:Domain of unknown function (DUF4386)
MIKRKSDLGSAALVAGIAYLIMIASPLAEVVYNRLVISGDAAQTSQNILAHRTLFNLGIFAYMINFMGDILSAWALYILLKPVHANLSLLTAWVKLVYAALSLVAVFNLLNVLGLLQPPDYLKAFTLEQRQAQVMLSLNAFRNGWSFAFNFFGVHLLLVGYLAFRSGYIPKWVGIAITIAGCGWLADNLQPFLYPWYKVNIGMFAGLGELVFMFWLLIKGWRISRI